jgi:hypothetical protein
MRIEFANSARGDVHWSRALLRIGSASDNDLVLADVQVADHHAQVHQDRRGLVLEVLPGAGRVYVNARPVRERAILREGDSLSIGECRMLLRADTDVHERSCVDAQDARAGAAALRALAGPLSGRVMGIAETLVLGPLGRFPLELPQGENATLQFGWDGGCLLLDANRVPTRYVIRVNGISVREAVLQPGDQIGIGAHRFTIDAAGWMAEPVAPSTAPPVAELPEDAAGPRGEVWWLILTAALLALGIAMVLLVRF